MMKAVPLLVTVYIRLGFICVSVDAGIGRAARATRLKIQPVSLRRQIPHPFKNFLVGGFKTSVVLGERFQNLKGSSGRL
jgi:hypothetical protein